MSAPAGPPRVAETLYWRAGPWVLEAPEWPERWVTMGREHYDLLEAEPASEDAHLRTKVRLRELGPRWNDDKVVVDDVQARLEEDRIHISGTEAFRAEFDVKGGDLAIDVLEDFRLAEVTLGNAVRAAMATWLPVYGQGLMMHASGGVLGDDAVLIAGLSGAGKTTLALAMEEARFLSDDINLVHDTAGEPWLGTSPFFGSAGRRGHRTQGPLRAVALLSQSPTGETSLQRLPSKAAVFELMRHVVCFGRDARLQQAILDRVAELCDRTPVFELSRALETSADDVVKRLIQAGAASASS